jgi:phage terminase large subunit
VVCGDEYGRCGDAGVLDPHGAAGLMQITLPHNWSPRPYQRGLWKYLSRGGKRAVAAWHRRAGKDEVCLHHTACSMHERVANYWHMLPEYSQARKAIWDAVNPHTGKRRIDEAFPREIRKFTREQEMMIGLPNGSTWQVVGSDNYNSLMGTPPAGVVMSEFALGSPVAWGHLSPILMENGGWALFISTPRGKNHFKAMLDTAKRREDWFSEVLTNDQTGVFTAEQLQAELENLQDMHGDQYGKSLWLQEYFCSFDAAIPGSVWGDCLDKAQLAGRIGVVPFDPAVDVHTAWDLGRTDATAIWFYQHVGAEIHVIGYHESSLKDIPYYADLLKSWAKDRKARYGTHWLPHDARARTLAAGGKSIQQQMNDHKVGRIAIAKRLDHVEGIQAARATFPFCYFDEDACGNGLEVLRSYHYEWDEEKRIFSNMPMHDWASHGASAFRTLALSWKRPKEGKPDSPILDRIGDAKFDRGVTFGAMRDQHLKKRRAERELH